MKFTITLLFLAFCSAPIPHREDRNCNIKSAQIKFRYHNTVRESEIFEGISYFDNYGEKTLTLFNKQRGTDLVKILKRDSFEYDFTEYYSFRQQRGLDMCIDPIINLNGTDTYFGEYKTSNMRDTIFNKMKCSAYDIIFTRYNRKGLLITYKNIKMYYYFEFDNNANNMYSVTSIDTSGSKVKAELFEPPR